MPKVTYQVSTQLGDGYQRSDNLVVGVGSAYTVILGNIPSYGEINFLRFTNIDIPQSATINSAKLTFIGYNTHTSGGTPPDVTISAEDSADPPVLKLTNSYVSGLSKTTNTVAWTNPASFVAEQETDSPDIKTIVQEIINKAGWTRGNPINFLLDVGGAVAAGNWNRAYSYDASSDKAVKLEINYTERADGLAASGKAIGKRFYHKVLDSDRTLVTTWGINDVLNTPDFKWSINGGMGQQSIVLARPLKSYGEGTEVAMGNIIETYIQDRDQEAGKKIWEGVINNYEPIVKEDGKQAVNVLAISRMFEMSRRIVKNASNETTVTFNSADPTNIFKALINSSAAGSILKEGDMDDVGTTVTYEFVANTFAQAYQEILKITSQYWYWYLNAHNEINFKKANFDEIQHKLYIGKEVQSIVATKSNENLINRVFFMGGGDPNLFKTYERGASQTAWGLREEFIKDERVTVDATAQIIATRKLDDNDHPTSEIEAQVLDNNIAGGQGYDIEGLKPGDIVQIRHPEIKYQVTNWDEFDWDNAYWDYDVEYSIGQPHQIVEIHYMYNKVLLKLANKPESVPFRIEDINRNLHQTATVNIPAQAS